MISYYSTGLMNSDFSFANQKEVSFIEPIEKKFVHKLNEFNVAISEIDKIFTTDSDTFYTCQLLPGSTHLKFQYFQQEVGIPGCPMPF